MTRSRLSMWICSLLVLALVAPPLMAQEGEGRQRGQGREGRQGRQGRQGGAMGMRRGGGMDMLGLLRIQQVQEELKITEEQKTKIGEVQTAMRESMGGFDFRGMRELSQEEREKKMAEYQEMRKKATAGAEKKLAGVLEKKQMKRLAQIKLQRQGIQGLKDEKIVKALKLTKEQLAKVDAAMESGREAQTKLMEELRGDGGGRRMDQEAFAKWREAREKIQKDTMASAIKALTEEQQKQYTKMKGKEFELDMQRAFQRGGRGGARGGAGQGGEGGARRRRPEGEV